MNLLVLSQMLNDTELEKYNGLVTFKIEPHIEMWDIQINRIKSDSVVGIHEVKADLDKAMNLSVQQEDIYLSPAELSHVPKTLMESIIKSDFCWPIALINRFNECCENSHGNDKLQEGLRIKHNGSYGS